MFDAPISVAPLWSMQLDPFVSHASEVAAVHAVHGVHLKLRLDVVKEQHLMVLRRCV